MLEPKDNTVNINPTAAKKPYHHGDLRDALIEAGMAMLDHHTTQELSLRQLARNAGVSATAVYRHFPDKDSLLRALAAKGFAMMGDQQSQAATAAAATSKTATFAAVGAAYVRFALSHPALFRLMFASAPPRDLFSLPDHDISEPLRLLRANVTAIAPPNTPAETQKIIAIRAWSLVHGLATLALDNIIPLDDAIIEGVVGGLFK